MSRLQTEVRLGHAANCSALGNVLNVLVWSQVLAASVWAAAEAWQTRRRRDEPGGGQTRLTEHPSALVRTTDDDGRSGDGEGGGGGGDGGRGDVRGDGGGGDGGDGEGGRGEGDGRGGDGDGGGGGGGGGRGGSGGGKGDGGRSGGGGGSATPREAHLQITQVCGLPCAHCYMDNAGTHLPLDTVKERLDALAAQGVMRVALGGGEPLRHPELPAIAEHARGLGLAVGVTTSGVGPDADLHSFDQVNVSLDGLGDVFIRTRGYDGSGAALDRIRTFAARGIRTGVNLVLDQLTFETVEETVAAAIAAGASDVQLLRLKPVGKALTDYSARRLTPDQALAVWPLCQRLMARFPDVTVRLDCASVPWLAAHDLDLDRMRAFGFRGCHGVVDLVSVDTSGVHNPCSFAPFRPGEDWAAGVRTGPCTTCSFHFICKGGCHAVAGALTGDRFSPDPECPRVLAWRPAAGEAQTAHFPNVPG